MRSTRKREKCTDIYEEPIITETDRAIVRVYHPILTPEERERRMKLIEKVAADFLRDL